MTVIGIGGGAEVVENAISVTENVAKFSSNLLTLDSGTLLGLSCKISVSVNDDLARQCARKES